MKNKEFKGRPKEGQRKAKGRPKKAQKAPNFAFYLQKLAPS
jgi:hypothetical protein